MPGYGERGLRVVNGEESGRWSSILGQDSALSIIREKFPPVET